MDHIIRMEQSLEHQNRLLEQLDQAMRELEGHRAECQALGDYYGSEQWVRDLEDDEAHRIPQEWKRGVLSQDGIWALLEHRRETALKMIELGLEILKE